MGRVSVLSPRTNVLICVLMDSHEYTQTATNVLCVLTDTHGRPVCADGHPRTHIRPVCADGMPRTSCVMADTHRRPPTWAKITQTVHGKGQRAESKDQRADIQPTWAKITRTIHGKGQHAESKDQRADMCTDGQPRIHTDSHGYVQCVMADINGRPVCTGQTAHGGQNHPNSPRE
ncbi:unnamed protein product, partial [Brassica rapa]